MTPATWEQRQPNAESGDALGEALKTKDMKKSLAALNSTLTKCVACHDAYKQ